MISNKLVALVAIVGLAGAMGFTSVGCSDSGSGDDDSDGGSSGGSSGKASSSGGSSGGSSSGKTPIEAGASSSSGGPEACFAGAGPLVYEITKPSQLGTGVCNDSSFDDFITACAEEASTQAGCTAFLQGACGSCMFGSQGSDAATPLFIAGGSIIHNANGCYAILGDADAECIQTASSTGLCIYQGQCSECDSQADKADYDACIAEAQSNEAEGCKQVIDAADACIGEIPDSKSAYLAANCAAESDPDFDAIAKKLIRTFCGTGPVEVDGGTTDGGNDGN